MKRRLNGHEQENCEGWLSTRNRKKVCPSVSSKHPVAYKHASFSFMSTSKLTQNSAPLNQRQMSILKFVHKDEQNFGAVKTPDQEKVILSDIQKINPDFDAISQKNTANTAMNKEEYKQFQSFQQPTDENSSRLKGNFEKMKRKDFDSYEKQCSKENCFPEEDPICVETDNKLNKMNLENVSLNLVRNTILLDTSNLSRSKTFCGDKIDFDGKNNPIFNKFESPENALPSNPPPKNTSTPTKNIKFMHQDPPIITGLKSSIDCNGVLLKDSLLDCQKESNVLKCREICRHHSDKSPNKKMLTDRGRRPALWNSEDDVLPKSKFHLKADNCESKECVFDLNPQERNSSHKTVDGNDLFEEKSVRDSLTDFSEYPPTFPILSKSSGDVLQEKVFSNSETSQTLTLTQNADFFPISNSCKQEDDELNDSNHILLSNCEERQWTHHVNCTGNRSTLSECDFETASTSDGNTCQFDEYFESSECKQESSDEDLILELYPDFTLRTQRSVNEEMSLDLIPETEDFTFNSDPI